MQHPIARRALNLAALAAVCGATFTSALAAAPSAQTLTLTHAKGTTEVPAAPRRVVVYDLGSLDTLQALDIPVAGVPKAQYPQHLQGYADARYTVAGSLFEPDYGALSQLRPDLIIVGGRSGAKYEVLSKIAPTVDLSVRSTHLLQDVERNVTQLARLHGRQARGEALVKTLHSEVEALRQLAGQAAPGVLMMGINERVMPQAPGSRFGFLFDVFGAKSLVQAQDVPQRGSGKTFGFEELAKLQPEWIWVIDRNTAVGSAAGGGEIVPSTQVFDHPLVHGTPAGQKGQVVFLDPKGWYLMGSAGPITLRNNVAQLREAFARAAAR